MKLMVDGPILIICFWATIFSSCIRQTELEGRWTGCEIRKPLIDWSLNIQGEQFHLIREDIFIWYKGRFKLNKNCALRKIDFQIDDTNARSQNGNTMLGIYEIDNDILTVVVGIDCNSPRPDSFDESRHAAVFNFVKS